MNINIYYGGRGLIDDPALYAINKFQTVLEELRVNVKRFNIFEQKNHISLLPQTLKEADGIILSTTVEWLGIGGFMQQFLDACWLYADKAKISSMYMQPIVMSTTYGEREALLTLQNAWEILGGIPCNGLCAYVDDLVAFEMNQDYSLVIEKSAESLYRTISQKIRTLPTSNQAVKQSVLRSSSIELTPQESEQLSRYAADDTYVKKQKEDIEELTNIFQGMMQQKEVGTNIEYISDFESNFIPVTDFKAIYEITITDKPKPLILDIQGNDLNCFYGNVKNADIAAKLSADVLNSVISGRKTFQRAFMTGEMTSRGDFKILRMLDQIFSFH